MVYNLIKQCGKKYTGNPLPFLYILLIRFFSVIITGFSAISIILLFILVLTAFNLMNLYGLITIEITVLLAFAFFFYFWAAYEGAMIKMFMNAEKQPVHFHDYLNYAIKNGFRNFKVFLLKNTILLLLTLPVLIVFIFFKIDPFSIIGIALIIIQLLLLGVAKFFLLFVYIASVVDEKLTTFGTVKNSIKFVLKNIFSTFVLYLLYGITCILLFIPIINIFILISLYPIIYDAIINIYKAKTF